MRETGSLSRSITEDIATAIGATVIGGVMVTSVTIAGTATALGLSSDLDISIMAITAIMASMVGITVGTVAMAVITTELARADSG